MLSPQLAVLLQMWWREGERRNLMLPAPDASRSGRYCGFVADTARIVVSTRSLKLVTVAPNRPGRWHPPNARPRATSEGNGQGDRDIAAADLQM